jgi:hypothetical protein
VLEALVRLVQGNGDVLPACLSVSRCIVSEFCPSGYNNVL